MDNEKFQVPTQVLNTNIFQFHYQEKELEVWHITMMELKF